MCVCVRDAVISLNTQTEQVLVKLKLPLFFHKKKKKKNNNIHLCKETQKHTRTTIVIHSTVRLSMSYPVSAGGSCPNKGALHSFIVLPSFSYVSHTSSFFFPSILERESGRRCFL